VNSKNDSPGVAKLLRIGNFLWLERRRAIHHGDVATVRNLGESIATVWGLEKICRKGINTVNVSKEADAAFMADLKRNDKGRYDRLVANMMKEAARLRRLSQSDVISITSTCAHCGLRLPNGLRADARYCDSTCQRNARHTKTGVRRAA
jgi:hypothetical protein